jgi:hypothetical protein
MADSNTPQDKMMAAMNGSGDAAKLSGSAAKALRKVALAKAMEAKKRAAAKQSAKVVPMKKPIAKKAPKKTAAPVKKAAANKKVVRKTMKTVKKARKKSR